MSDGLEFSYSMAKISIGEKYIFVKEAIYKLQNRDPEFFRAERIESDVFGTLIAEIHAVATKDLNEFLFKEDYEPKKSLKIIF